MIWDVDSYIVFDPDAAFPIPMSRSIITTEDMERRSRVEALVRQKQAQNYQRYLRRKERRNGAQGGPEAPGT